MARHKVEVAYSLTYASVFYEVEADSYSEAIGKGDIMFVTDERFADFEGVSEVLWHGEVPEKCHTCGGRKQ